MAVVISENKCIACGACVVVCPRKAIRLERGVARVDPARCTLCRRCICKCYTRAIRIPDSNT